MAIYFLPYSIQWENTPQSDENRFFCVSTSVPCRSRTSLDDMVSSEDVQNWRVLLLDRVPTVYTLKTVFFQVFISGNVKWTCSIYSLHLTYNNIYHRYMGRTSKIIHMIVWHKTTIRHYVFILELYPMIHNFVIISCIGRWYLIYFIFKKHNHYDDLQLFSVNLVLWFIVLICFKTYDLNNA